MRYFLGVGTLMLVISLYSFPQKLASIKAEDATVMSNFKAQDSASEVQSEKDVPHPLDRKISELSAQVEEIDARLYSKGFPKVLSYENLSEIERDEIIQLMNRGSGLYAELIRLKSQRIDQIYQ